MTEASAESRRSENWTLFCLLIVGLKLLLFALDPSPKLFMGDSGSYLWTAISGWLPEDRSYFYGYVIRWSSAWTESLTSLLLLQLVLSAGTCLLLAWVVRFVFALPARWSYAFGFICALDPLQLLYERYVMTEAISLFLYALALHRAFLYLRDRRWRDLALVQVISVFVIGFRMSYLMLVQIDTLLLPLIAFSGDLWGELWHRRSESASRWRVLRTAGSHLLISIVLMSVLHTGYKQLNGLLSHREPAYLYVTGITLLAFWSPALEPEDSPDPRLAELIRRGDELGLKDYRLRNSQRFSPGRLVDRVKKLDPDRGTTDALAKQTALHAFRRNPLAVLDLAWEVYRDYWSVAEMKRSVVSDFSLRRPPPAGVIAELASNFHFAYENGSQGRSLLQRYFFAAWPYYFFILISPLVAAGALIPRVGREYGVLLFVHISQMLGIAMLFGGDSVRFLQPISFATLLVLALLAKAAMTRSHQRERTTGDTVESDIAGPEADQVPGLPVALLLPAAP